MVEMGKMNKDCPLKKRVQNEKNKEETWKGMTEKKNEHNRDNYHESCVCKLCERNGCDRYHVMTCKQRTVSLAKFCVSDN